MMATDVLREEARKQFEKRFDLNHEANTVQIDLGACFEKLQKVKLALNEIKAALNDKDPIEWHQHTTITNRAANVNYKVRKLAKPTLLTQAWLKFYEILCEYPVLAQSAEIRSFHLCEAPGAFVAALEHYLLSKFGNSDKWFWRASSLNPYFEGNDTDATLVDDRLLLSTLENWYFGQSQTGDVFTLDIPEHFSGSFDLCTGDGSVDCQDNPGDQELSVLPLQIAETKVAVQLLRKGGSFVLKLFTWFEKPTLAFLNILYNLFDQMSFRKPSCSKAGNSEVYLICTGFRASSSSDAVAILDKCLGSLDDFAFDPFLMSELGDAMSYFATLQADTIKENVSWFQVLSRRQRQKFDTVKRMVADVYYQRYIGGPLPPTAIRSISWRETCLHGADLSRGRAWNVAPFAERLGNKQWWRHHADTLLDRLDELAPGHVESKRSTSAVYRCNSDGRVPQLSLTMGPDFGDKVKLSKFCHQPLLDLFHMIGVDTVESGDDQNGGDCSPVRGRAPPRVDVVGLIQDGADRLNLLSQLCDVIGDSKRVPAFSLVLGETLSRFAVGVIFLVSRLFCRVEAMMEDEWIVWTFLERSDDDSGAESDDLNDEEYSVVRNAVLQHFRDIVAKEGGVSGGKSPLEVTPLAPLVRSRFAKFVRRLNDRLLYERDRNHLEAIMFAERRKRRRVDNEDDSSDFED